MRIGQRTGGRTVIPRCESRPSGVHQLFAACHGLELEGTDRGPSHLSIVYEPGHHGDDAFRMAIANGAPQHHWNFGDMPPVEGLSADQIEDVIAYIRGEQERRGYQD